MNRTVSKTLIIAGAWLAVLLPLFVHFKSSSWDGTDSVIHTLFPAFGLLAASLLWLHAISGVWEEKLTEMFDFDFFIHTTASLILFSIIAHPLLLLILIKFHISLLFNDDVMLGALGLVLLLTYDITKPFRKSGFFSRHWNKILIVSNIGFLLTFFHSLELGSDLQSGLLRYLWMFYGITGAFAIAYTYGIKWFLNKS